MLQVGIEEKAEATYTIRRAANTNNVHAYPGRPFDLKQLPPTPDSLPPDAGRHLESIELL